MQFNVYKINRCCRVGDDQEIIYIQYHEHKRVISLVDANIGIRMELGKSLREKEGIHLVIPSSRGLFEAINGFFKSAHH
jgi:hypothetical protein